MKEKKECGILLDVSAIMYRAYYAHIYLRSENKPTGAIFGFINTLENILNELSPSYVVAALDVTRKSLKRTEKFEGYKSNRSAMPDDLQQQLPLIKELLDIYGIKQVTIPGNEADDVLGTYAKFLSKEDIENYIITGDKDLSQVLDKNINIALLGKGTGKSRLKYVKTEEDVVEQLGVKPNKIPDLFGLIGDASDGIPGVRKIGPKKAILILDKYKDLEGVYENVDSLVELPGIGKSLVTNIKEDKELAFLSRELAVIDQDLPVEYKLEDLTMDVSYDRLKKFVLKYELNSLVKKIEKYNGVNEENKEEEVIEEVKPLVIKDEVEIKNLEDLTKVMKKIGKNKGFTFSEYSNGIVITTDEKLYTASYNPPICITRENTRDLVRKNLENLENGIFISRKEMYKEGYFFDNTYMDLSIGNYILTNNTKDGIEEINERYNTGYKVYSEDHPITKEEVIANNEALLSMGIEMRKKLEKEELLKIYDLEHSLTKILFNMENVGIMIDKEYFKNYSKELSEKIEKLIPEIKDEIKEGVIHNIKMMDISEDKVRELIETISLSNIKKKKEKDQYKEEIQGIELEKLLEENFIYNMGSPKQLGIILFDLLKMPKIKKTSVGVEVLEELKGFAINNLPKLILEYRKLTKLLNTYVDALPKLADKDNLLHTTFNQTGTATGRLSSNNPNLQNIPVRSEEGLKIRQGFIPGEGNKFLAIDYSQIELRVLAEVSRDETLINAYENDLDLHELTARKLFSLLDDEKVSSLQRNMAKTVNFSIIYGKTAFGLSKELDITPGEAKEYITRYFNQYPRVRELEEKIISEAKVDGYVKTIYGRRRILNGINSSNKIVSKQSERMAVNSVIQGSAADLLKMVMVELGKRLEGEEDVKMSIQVHDELIFIVKEDRLEYYSEKIKKIMEETIKLEKVDLKANIATGSNWSEAK